MKRLFFCLTALLLLIGCTNVSAKKLDLYAFPVGKADALFVRTNDASIMIDTGENGDGAELVARLRELGTKKLDVLILTHFDKDHIGGADAIIRAFPIDRIVLPAYEKESKQFSQLSDALKSTSAEILTPTEDLDLQFGETELLIWPSPVPFDGKSDNEQSLIAKILYDGKTYVFMGDAEKEELKQLVFSGRNLTCDVLKLPHHGVYDENTFALIVAAMPSHVIICDSEKNPAAEKTLQTMELFAPVILQTKDGEVHLTAAGGVIKSE